MSNAEMPDRGRHRALPAWVVFVVSLTVEYLAVSFSVDARDLAGPANLESTLGRVGDAAPLAFLFPAAVFLTGGHTVRLRLRALSAYRTDPAPTLILGLIFMALALAVLGLSRWIATGTLAPAQARTWLLVWAGAGVSSAGALALALWTPKMIVRALSGLRRELALGVMVSGVAWVTGLLSRSLWKPLAWLTLELAHAILTVLASDPVASMDEALVGTSRFYVRVAPVCSGIEGIALMLTFVGAYLFLARRQLKWPLSLVLLPASALLVWALNVVRVVGLIAVGTWYSPEIALGGFHSKAGWVFFSLCALGTVYFVQQSPWFQVSPGPGSAETAVASGPPTEDHSGSTIAYLAPLLAVLAAKLLTGLVATNIDYFYGISVAAAAFALWKFRGRYPELSLGSPWLPLAVGAGVALAWIIGFGSPSGPSPLRQALSALPFPLTALWLLLRAVGMVVTVPIVEELAFRGYLQRRFSSPAFDRASYRDFSWLGLIVASICFGLLHSHWTLGIGAGFAFGILAIARGRLSDAILAHATANAAIFVYALLTQDYALIA